MYASNISGINVNNVIRIRADYKTRKEDIRILGKKLTLIDVGNKIFD